MLLVAVDTSCTSADRNVKNERRWELDKQREVSQACRGLIVVALLSINLLKAAMIKHVHY